MLLCAVLAVSLAMSNRTPGQPVRATLSDTDLFNLTNVHTIHLNFTAEQWEAIEPKGGRGFGGPGGPPGGGPGGGGPIGDFGPGMFIAPIFLRLGDANHDGKLTQKEFNALGEKWFLDWDTNKTGKLDAGKFRSGLNSTLQSLGGPGGPGGPPPGGGGGPGPGLQAAQGARNGVAGAAGIVFPTVKADLQIDGLDFPSVAVRYKGNGTYMQSSRSLKRSLKIDLNDYASGRRLGGVTKINLHSGVTDPSMMNEVLAHQVFRDTGVPAPRTSYAEVYLTVPGKHTNTYMGLYSIVENIDNNFAKERYATKKGAIFKPVGRQLFEYQGNDWSAYKQAYDPKTPVSDEETRRVIAFSKLVSQANDEEFAAHVEEFLDLDEFARFMATTTWLSTLDSILAMGQNFVVYLHPKTRQFQFLPWDLDHAFGRFPMMGSQDQRNNLSIHKPWSGKILFLERVYKVEKFKRIYLAHMAKFSQTVYQPKRIEQQVDELAQALRPSVARESEEKLSRFDQAVKNEPAKSVNADNQFGRPSFGGPGGFMSADKPIKAFVAVRTPSVIDQLAGRTNGLELTGFGPGGPGGPGGGPGRPGDFGPGMFLGPVFMTALDTDKDNSVTHDEFLQVFNKWFVAWDKNHSGTLTEEQLRAGVNKDLFPSRGGPPGMPFGEPDMEPMEEFPEF